jgi:hypothetical protein
MQGLLPSVLPLDTTVVPVVGFCRSSPKGVGLQRATRYDSNSADKLDTRRPWQHNARRELVGIRGYHAIIDPGSVTHDWHIKKAGNGVRHPYSGCRATHLAYFATQSIVVGSISPCAQAFLHFLPLQPH